MSVTFESKIWALCYFKHPIIFVIISNMHHSWGQSIAAIISREFHGEQRSTSVLNPIQRSPGLSQGQFLPISVNAEPGWIWSNSKPPQFPLLSCKSPRKDCFYEFWLNFAANIDVPTKPHKINQNSFCIQIDCKTSQLPEWLLRLNIFNYWISENY